MKVSELIYLLEKIENKDKKVLISVGQYNKVYPVAYCKLWASNYLWQSDYAIRINITLPDNMYTVVRR